MVLARLHRVVLKSARRVFNFFSVCLDFSSDLSNLSFKTLIDAAHASISDCFECCCGGFIAPPEINDTPLTIKVPLKKNLRARTKSKMIGKGMLTQAWRQMTAASTLHCQGIRNFAAPAKQKSKAALKSPIDALQMIKTSAKCKFDERYYFFCPLTIVCQHLFNHTPQCHYNLCLLAVWTLHFI